MCQLAAAWRDVVGAGAGQPVSLTRVFSRRAKQQVVGLVGSSWGTGVLDSSRLGEILC